MCGGLGAPWILDPGSWNLWAVGLGVRAGPPGFWMLESVGGVGRRGPAADSVFCILETGLSEGRSTGVGRPDSVFCILEAWASRVAGPPGFCILYSVFCPRHVHVMHGGLEQNARNTLEFRLDRTFSRHQTHAHSPLPVAQCACAPHAVRLPASLSCLYALLRPGASCSRGRAARIRHCWHGRASQLERLREPSK